MRCTLALIMTALILGGRQPAAGCGIASRDLTEQAVSADLATAEHACEQLRQLGPRGLEALFNRYRPLIDQALADQSPADRETETQWQRVRQALDRVAGQRDAHAAQLFWYTDWEQAQATAKRTNKPILSLRLLGRLTDEYSCANSRFFRSTLYANQEVGRLLRERFVLHWQSVRPVPVVTIDFGDGRKLQRTVTGNSAHYVLDVQGRILDVLPGLYGPQAFAGHLQRAERLALELATADADTYRQRLTGYHRQQLDALRSAWARDLIRLGVRPANAGDAARPSDQPRASYAAQAAAAPPAQQARAAGPAVKASLRAMPKHRVEAPVLAAVLNVSEESLVKATTDDLWARLAQLHAAEAQLDANTLAVIMRQAPPAAVAAETTVTKMVAETPLMHMLHNLRQTISLDSVRNEYLLHRQIHGWFAAGQVGELAALNERVYAELFLTPSSDPWLGLLPQDTYSALDNNGVVECRR